MDTLHEPGETFQPNMHLVAHPVGMKASSQDLRLRVLRAIDAGASQSQVAEQFAVSVATIKRYLKQRPESGHVRPKAIPGRPRGNGEYLGTHQAA